MKNKNLQAKIASLKTYLDDCRAGIWSVKAWNDHKSRMAALNSPALVVQSGS